MLRPVRGTHPSLVAPHLHCAHGAPPHLCRTLLFASGRFARVMPQCSTAAQQNAAAKSPTAACAELPQPRSSPGRPRAAAAADAAVPADKQPLQRMPVRPRTAAAAAGAGGPSKPPAGGDGQAPGSKAAAAAPAVSHNRRTYKDIAWTPEVEADVLRFWTKRGVLLPAGQPAATAEAARQQRDLRRKLCKWARKHDAHRNTACLEHKMAQWDAAAQSTGWGGDVNSAFLSNTVTMWQDPITFLANLRQLEVLFARHNVRISLGMAVQLTRYTPQTLEARLPAVLSAIATWPVAVDPARIVAYYPGMLQKVPADFVVYEERLRVMQKLHPLLDVAAVVTKQPALLMLPAATIINKRTALHSVASLDSSQVLSLVHCYPNSLCSDMTRIADKLHAMHRFESQRAAAGQSPAQFSFPSWVANTMKRSDVRMLRLDYLLECAGAGNAAALIKPAYTIVRQPNERFDRSWPGFEEWCIPRVS